MSFIRWLVCTSVFLLSWFSANAQPPLPPGMVLGAVGGVTRSSAVVGFRTESPGARVQVIYHPALGNRQFNPNHPTARTTSQPFTTRSQDDNTGSIRLTGLREDTLYLYRIVVNNKIQQVPSAYEQMFRTFPSPGQEVVFSVFTDASNNAEVNNPAKAYESGGYNPGSSRDPLFALQIGDFDHSNPMSIRESRAMHKWIRDTRTNAGAQFVANVLTKMSLAHIWDDHDYCDNDSDRTCPHKGGATKAFREYYPGYPQANPSEGIWYSFRAGDAELFVIDTRSRRDPGTWPDNEDKSMLDGGGSIPNDQVNWLLQGVTSSSATWKIIVSSTPTNRYSRIGVTRDNWTTYSAEANRIARFFRQNPVDNVVLITGDIHTGGGIDDGRNSLWGLPEVTVPHTNLHQGWNIEHVGRWSDGIVSGDNSQLRGEGYVSVRVTPRSLTLNVCDRDGRLKLGKTFTARGRPPSGPPGNNNGGRPDGGNNGGGNNGGRPPNGPPPGSNNGNNGGRINKFGRLRGRLDRQGDAAKGSHEGDYESIPEQASFP